MRDARDLLELAASEDDEGTVADIAAEISALVALLALAHLHQAAQALQDGNDAVFIPAEDGGYALVGLRRALPEIFHDVDWGSERVMTQTRERMKCLGLHWSELETLWDVDRPEDVVRWREGCGNNGISPVGAGDALYGEAVVDH